MKSPPALIRQALDPQASVVVEACAGSGKTWLLVSRILRLLLAGAKPSEILAITFTRKAAQEMQARLNQWLRELATQPETRVRDFLRARGVDEPELGAALAAARDLFEQTLRAEPPITIDTFHGWFLKLLRHAPLTFSAGGQVALLDQTASLREEAWQDFADRLAGAGDCAEAQALLTLLREYGLAATRRMLDDFLAHRTEWLAYAGSRPDPAAWAWEHLRQTLAVDPLADPVGAYFAAGGEDDAAFLAALLEQGTDKQREKARLLERNGRDPRTYFEAIRSIALTAKGTPVQNFERLAQRQGPAALARYHSLCAAIVRTEEALRAQRILRLHGSAFRCATAYLEHYQRLKESRGAMDFADIELFAWQLLSQGDHAEYLQYKLDARYRHILLDEFQDTNPVQWQILRTWLAAAEAAERRPTVFLVGDPKQSIYRFRGAEARLFDLATDWLRRHYGAIKLEQDESRRCAPAIIDVVNRVFAQASDFRHFRAHSAHGEQPGGVVVLPLAEPGATAEPARDRLRDPLHEPVPESAAAPAVEARLLADTLRALVGRLPVTAHDGTRPARFGDIMVLARARTHLAHFEQAFKAAGIPYVTARKGGLLQTLEAADLTALLEFLVLPYADLRLAQVLKSPLFGANDTDLMRLAARDERTWWQRLTASAAEDTASAALARAAELLPRWRELTDRLPVHDLLDRIYFEGEVFARYRAAVPPPLWPGVEANLHAFLELALEIQGGRYPSLPRFLQELAGLRAAEEEAPDEGAPEADGDAVRILTIHGAKGLEAPIVCLIDANRAARDNDGYSVLVDWPPEADRPRHFSFHTRQDERGQARLPLFEEADALSRTEDLNLLYVALTRARQYLIASGSGRLHEEGWYARLCAAEPAHRLDLAGLPPASVQPGAPSPRLATDAPVPPPTGQRRDDADTPAIRRGIALHRVIEMQTGPEARADRQALRRELGLSNDAFAALWEEARNLLRAPALARFFDPARHRRALNEVPYVTADGALRRIDRLVEFEDEVWILDYKMGEPGAGEDPAGRAAPYRAQLMEYRQALASVYPGKRVRAAVIFADGSLYEFAAPGSA